MQFDRNIATGSRLLSRKAKIADEFRMYRIGEIVDLGHSAGAPAINAGNEVGNSCFAFPPVLVRSFKRPDAAHLLWSGRIGDIPDFVPGIAECSQQVEPAGFAAWQFLAGADANHLRAA